MSSAAPTHTVAIVGLGNRGTHHSESFATIPVSELWDYVTSMARAEGRNRNLERLC